MKIEEANINGDELSITNAIEGFLFHCRFEKNLNAKTLMAYAIDLKQFAAYMEGREEGRQFKKMPKEILKAYLQKISCFKPKTVKRKVASLKAMMNYLECEYDDYINPFRKIKVRLKEPYILPSVMTLGEVGNILGILYKERNNNKHTDKYSYKAQTRNIAVVEMLFSTGMRVSEVCNLKLENINLKNGMVKVVGKGSRERIIQMCQTETLAVIKAYYDLYKNQLQFGHTFFVNRLGNPLSSQSVRLMVKLYAHKAGILKKITPHTFRHTFATLLLEEDVDIRYIQHMLGHSSIAITQIYTHVNVEKQKKILTEKHPRRKLDNINCSV